MRIIFVLITAAAIAGCASEPTQRVSEAAQVPAAAAPTSAAAAAAATKPDTMSEAEAPATKQFQPPAGYQKKTKGKSTVYCRSDTPVGTRFATEYCYTQADLERMEASRDNIRREVDRARRTCVGTGCGGG